MLSRFHLILECYGQTDGQFAISISRISMLTRDKKIEPSKHDAHCATSAASRIAINGRHK